MTDQPSTPSPEGLSPGCTCERPLVGIDSAPPSDPHCPVHGLPAVVRANVALVQLREAMAEVRLTTPAYVPGHGPTAADTCKHVLDLIDYGIRQLAAFQGMNLDA
jgi:hypothetical protein